MVCDRVAIIVKGRIRFAGTADQFREGGEPEVDIVLAGLQPEAAAVLEEEFGAELRGLRDRIEVRVAGKHVDEVLRGSLEEGARVVSVTPHRVSLESIFLSAVEKDAAEEKRR